MARRKQPARRAAQQQKSRPRPAPGPAQARPRQADHATVYDQDEGRAQPPRGAAQAARRQQQRRRRLTQAEMRRRRLRRRLVTGVLLLTAVAVGLVFSVALLFKVTAFEFQDPDGNTPADTGLYTQEEIVAALSVTEGDNLFSFRSREEAARLETRFPLLESIEVRRRLPGTVVVRVKPAVATYCVRTDSGWAVLSETCKVISVTGEQPDLPVLKVSNAAVPQVGLPLALLPTAQAESGAAAEQPEEAGALEQMLAALAQAGILQDMTELDVSDENEISFVHEDRIRVKIGTVNELDYKMKWAAKLLRNESGDLLSAADRGILDVSHILSNGTIEPTFAWGDPHASPTPVPSEAPEEDPASSQPEDPDAQAPAT